jgi:hypothetical protein
MVASGLCEPIHAIRIIGYQEDFKRQLYKLIDLILNMIFRNNL